MPTAVCAWRRCTMRSASGYGSGRSSTPLITLKIAVLAPMPRPSVRMNARANPGMRGRLLRAMRMSLIMGDLSRFYRSKRCTGGNLQENREDRRGRRADLAEVGTRLFGLGQSRVFGRAGRRPHRRLLRVDRVPLPQPLERLRQRLHLDRAIAVTRVAGEDELIVVALRGE